MEWACSSSQDSRILSSGRRSDDVSAEISFRMPFPDDVRTTRERAAAAIGRGAYRALEACCRAWKCNFSPTSWDRLFCRLLVRSERKKKKTKREKKIREIFLPRRWRFLKFLRVCCAKRRAAKCLLDRYKLEKVDPNEIFHQSCNFSIKMERHSSHKFSPLASSSHRSLSYFHQAERCKQRSPLSCLPVSRSLYTVAFSSATLPAARDRDLRRIIIRVSVVLSR